MAVALATQEAGIRRICLKPAQGHSLQDQLMINPLILIKMFQKCTIYIIVQCKMGHNVATKSYALTIFQDMGTISMSYY
jgi:hypothetical protein